LFDYFDTEAKEKEYPGCYMIPPMLANKIPKNKQHVRRDLFENGDYFAEAKIDGHCYTFEHTMDGNTYMFARTISRGNGLLVEKSDRVPHLVESLKSIFKPGTVVALELYLPNKKAKDVTTIMGCLPAKAIERQQKTGYIHAYLHDILVIDNQSIMDKGAFERLTILDMLTPKDWSSIVVVYPVTENIEHYLATVWQNGGEGIILKRKDSVYSPGKRPAWQWLKFKQEEDFDVVCTGFLPPTKEYTGRELDNWKYYEGDIPVTKPYANGWVGSLIMSCYKDGELMEIGSVASGLTDSLLEKIKNNPDDYIMKPMVIKAMETTEDFKLREPKFIGFRDDINAKDCTFEKIFK